VIGAVGAIIVAAGDSRRMAGTDKLWLDLGGQPLLARTVEAISRYEQLGQLVVVASRNTLNLSDGLRNQRPWSRVDRWIAGGATRQDSVYHGLQALDRHDVVLIHDGARPLVRPEVLERGITTARQHGSAVACVPVTDTIKVVDADERVVATPERAGLRAAQTPQIFAWEILMDAYSRVGAARAGCTDDAAVLELAGFPVHTFLGDRANIKISTPADIAVARALWLALNGGGNA
jgi:2-C-methyl-D-erythritol 4-phosphate cytidylyltransferase